MAGRVYNSHKPPQHTRPLSTQDPSAHKPPRHTSPLSTQAPSAHKPLHPRRYTPAAPHVRAPRFPRPRHRARRPALPPPVLPLTVRLTSLPGPHAPGTPRPRLGARRPALPPPVLPLQTVRLTSLPGINPDSTRRYRRCAQRPCPIHVRPSRPALDPSAHDWDNNH